MQIYPKILLNEYLEDSPRVITQPWVQGHCIALVESDALVADNVDPHRYLMDDEVEDWDTSLRKAIENLHTLCQAKIRTRAMKGESGEVGLIVSEGHNHIAGLPLLESFIAQTTQFIGDGWLFCLPAIDELVAFVPEAAAECGQLTLDTFNSHTHPVSPHVFMCMNGEITLHHKVDY